MEVIIDNAETKVSLPGRAGASVAETSGSQVSMPNADVNAVSGGVSSVVGLSANVDNDMNSLEKDETNAQTVLLNLPQRELQVLCSLLAKEGYVLACSCILI